jgi:histone demethylase JARID1
MQAREMNERKALRKQSIKEQHIPETDENTIQEQRCVFCNCYTYLSHVSCTCTEKISCLDHVLEVKLICNPYSSIELTHFNSLLVMHLPKGIKNTLSSIQ